MSLTIDLSDFPLLFVSRPPLDVQSQGKLRPWGATAAQYRSDFMSLQVLYPPIETVGFLPWSSQLPPICVLIQGFARVLGGPPVISQGYLLINFSLFKSICAVLHGYLCLLLLNLCWDPLSPGWTAHCGSGLHAVSLLAAGPLQGHYFESSGSNVSVPGTHPESGDWSLLTGVCWLCQWGESDRRGESDHLKQIEFTS